MSPASFGIHIFTFLIESNMPVIPVISARFPVLVKRVFSFFKFSSNIFIMLTKNIIKILQEKEKRGVEDEMVR